MSLSLSLAAVIADIEERFLTSRTSLGMTC
jgi:hypothetical protein